MARTPRIVYPQYAHHVVTRGNNRRRLFSYASDYQRFLWDLQRATKKTGCALHTVTLMTNHVHLIVTPPDAEALPRFVKSFAQRYAQYRNRARRGSGKLFEERYFCAPILNERQMAVTTVYADLNALRGGIVRDPIRYPWSTFALHAGQPTLAKIPPRLITPDAWYLGLGATDAERSALFLEWVAACRAKDERPARWQQLAEIEALSHAPYTLRLRRPDGNRATERSSAYSAPGLAANRR